jgi:hypothetical protein
VTIEVVDGRLDERVEFEVAHEKVLDVLRPYVYAPALDGFGGKPTTCVPSPPCRENPPMTLRIGSSPTWNSAKT